MRRPLALAAILLVGAGCLGSGPSAVVQSTGTEPAAPVAPGSVSVSSTKGGIDGRAVDSSLSPIGGANVSLRESGPAGAVLKTTMTGEDGRFVFELLDPGTYRVSAGHVGFANSTVLAVVRAGEATTARLVFTELPTQEPYVQLGIQNGLINCAFAVVVVSGVCVPSVTQPVFGPYNVELKFAIPVGHQAVVSETDWANRPQVMRNWFFMVPGVNATYSSTGSKWMGDAIGSAVLRKEFRPETIPSSFYPGYDTPDNKNPFPPSSQNLTLEGITYFDGSYQKEINGTASPVCAQNPVVGYCTGVGVTFSQKYTQYVTTFVYQLPPNLSSYSAIPDE